jgi:hypothetical protein
MNVLEISTRWAKGEVVQGGGAGPDVSRIGRRAARGLVGPGFEVVDRVDDAAAELAEGRAAAVAAVFLQGTVRLAGVGVGC